MKLTWFRENGLMGIADADTDEVLIEPVYGEVSTRLSEEGYLRAWKNSRYGILDLRGRTILPFEYPFLGHFSSGLAPAASEGKYGYIDITGKFMIEPQFAYANSFSDGFAVVTFDHNKYYYIDTKGLVQNKQPFAIAWDFKGGYAVVAEQNVANTKFHLIDKHFTYQLQDADRFEHLEGSRYRVWKRDEFGLIPEKIFEPGKGFIPGPMKYSRYWSEYKRASGLIGDAIGSLPCCFCHYPRIMDMILNKHSEEGYILSGYFTSTLDDGERKDTEEDKWITISKCPKCNSLYEIEYWDYRSIVITVKKQLLNKAEPRGPAPMKNAPTFLTALSIQENGRDENLKRLNNSTLHSESIEKTIEYLFSQQRSVNE
jgi:hypothetical protein